MATEKLKSKWRECNKKRKQYMKKYYAKRTLRKIAYRLNQIGKSGITGFDLWKIAKKQRMKCALTGKKLTRDNISIDHIIPTSRGGLSILSNLRWVTLTANMAKKNMMDDEFVELCSSVINTCAGVPPLRV